MEFTFAEPGVFLTYGLLNGTWAPDVLARLCANSGFKWVVQEFGDPETQPPDDVITSFRSACHTNGLFWGAWEDQPRDLSTVDKYKPNIWILNVESDHYDYTALLQTFRKYYPKLPAAVITNCDFDPAPFAANNIKIMPEAYAYSPGQDPNVTPTNMVNRCKEMVVNGRPIWKKVFPCFGVFDGGLLSSYQAELHVGNGYSVFSAEGMMDDPNAWATAKTLNGG